MMRVYHKNKIRYLEPCEIEETATHYVCKFPGCNEMHLPKKLGSLIRGEYDSFIFYCDNDENDDSLGGLVHPNPDFLTISDEEDIEPRPMPRELLEKWIGPPPTKPEINKALQAQFLALVTLLQNNTNPKKLRLLLEEIKTFYVEWNKWSEYQQRAIAAMKVYARRLQQQKTQTRPWTYIKEMFLTVFNKLVKIFKREKTVKNGYEQC